jgi:hypothetical protein
MGQYFRTLAPDDADGFQTCIAGRTGGSDNMIRIGAAEGDDGVALVLQGFLQVMFQLEPFVA